jgi:hypothetical protein
MATGLQRTFGTPTNNKIFTLSLWLKRAANDTDSTITLLTGGGSSRPTSEFVLNSEALALSQYDGSSYNYNVRAYYKARDVSAWYHIVYTFDSTQATASDRVKFYMNGVLQNYNMQNTDYPSLNYVPAMNNATNHAIGGSVFGGFSASAECIMSHIHFIDGTAYDASAFGETDATTGEWKIKTSPSVTYGNNGFFILKDGNSVTDQSGNSNNWTVGGGTLTKTEDSPSNVFATGNPLHRGDNLSDATFSNGNTSHEGTVSGGSYPYTFSTLAASSGKWYAEFKRVHGETMMGIGRGKAATYLGSDTYEYAYFSTGILYGNDSDLGSYGSALNNNDIVGVAMDLDNNAVYWSINGVWQNSGVPTSGASKTGAQSITAASSNGYGVYHFAYGKGGSGVTDIEANFGNGYFGTTAVSSAGTNASGIGIFEYDVPTGYTALSTKGLNL